MAALRRKLKVITKKGNISYVTLLDSVMTITLYSVKEAGLYKYWDLNIYFQQECSKNTRVSSAYVGQNIWGARHTGRQTVGQMMCQHDCYCLSLYFFCCSLIHICNITQEEMTMCKGICQPLLYLWHTTPITSSKFQHVYGPYNPRSLLFTLPVNINVMLK